MFTHVFDDAAPAAQTAAGWECYLDRLDAQLDGQDLSEERAHQPVGERHERYAARFGLDPAPGRAFIATLGFRGLTLAAALRCASSAATTSPSSGSGAP